MARGQQAASASGGGPSLEALWKAAGLGNGEGSMKADKQLSRAAYGQGTAVGPSPSGRGSHVLFANSADTDLERLAAATLRTSEVRDPSPEQIANRVAEIRSMNPGRDDAGIMEQARMQQAISNSNFHLRRDAFEEGLTAARGNEELLAYTLSRVGVTPAAAQSPVGKAPTPEMAATAAANPQAVNPEVDNWWTASQPELKDVPVLGGLPRWGLAALGGGTTAATAGLAYHLMAQGQQQSDPVAYASAVQAMNAY